MMGHLFGNEGQLVSPTPGHGSVLNGLLGHASFLMGNVPMAPEYLAQDGIVGLLGDGTLSAGVVRRQVPLDDLHHPVFGILYVRYPEKSMDRVRKNVFASFEQEV